MAPVVKREGRKYKAYLINKNGQETFLPEIQGFEEEFSSDGLIGFHSPMQSGYVNCDGKICISGDFEILNPMEGGAAAVKAKGKWGLLGSDGKWKQNPRFGSFGRQHGPFFSFFEKSLCAGEEVVLNADGDIIWPRK